jgi:hypothetical protein
MLIHSPMMYRKWSWYFICLLTSLVEGAIKLDERLHRGESSLICFMSLDYILFAPFMKLGHLIQSAIARNWIGGGEESMLSKSFCLLQTLWNFCRPLNRIFLHNGVFIGAIRELDEVSMESRTQSPTVGGLGISRRRQNLQLGKNTMDTVWIMHQGCSCGLAFQQEVVC